MIKHLTNRETFHDEISSERLVLVDFYADWCEPCKWLDQILAEVESNFTDPLKILKVNTDKYLDLSHKYGLRSVPVLMIFQNGELVWRMNGFLTTGEMIEKLTSFSRET